MSNKRKNIVPEPVQPPRVYGPLEILHRLSCGFKYSWDTTRPNWKGSPDYVKQLELYSEELEGIIANRLMEANINFVNSLPGIENWEKANPTPDGPTAFGLLEINTPEGDVLTINFSNIPKTSGDHTLRALVTALFIETREQHDLRKWKEERNERLAQRFTDLKDFVFRIENYVAQADFAVDEHDSEWFKLCRTMYAYTELFYISDIEKFVSMDVGFSEENTYENFSLRCAELEKWISHFGHTYEKYKYDLELGEIMEAEELEQPKWSQPFVWSCWRYDSLYGPFYGQHVRCSECGYAADTGYIDLPDGSTSPRADAACPECGCGIFNIIKANGENNNPAVFAGSMENIIKFCESNRIYAPTSIELEPATYFAEGHMEGQTMVMERANPVPLSTSEKCPNDTDGDGNCSMCHKQGGCFYKLIIDDPVVDKLQGVDFDGFIEYDLDKAARIRSLWETIDTDMSGTEFAKAVSEWLDTVPAPFVDEHQVVYKTLEEFIEGVLKLRLKSWQRNIIQNLDKGETLTLFNTSGSMLARLMPEKVEPSSTSAKSTGTIMGDVQRYMATEMGANVEFAVLQQFADGLNAYLQKMGWPLETVFTTVQEATRLYQRIQSGEHNAMPGIGDFVSETDRGTKLGDGVCRVKETENHPEPLFDSGSQVEVRIGRKLKKGRLSLVLPEWMDLEEWSGWVYDFIDERYPTKAFEVREDQIEAVKIGGASQKEGQESGEPSQNTRYRKEYDI